jgi:hypothetical protein
MVRVTPPVTPRRIDGPSDVPRAVPTTPPTPANTPPSNTMSPDTFANVASVPTDRAHTEHQALLSSVPSSNVRTLHIAQVQQPSSRDTIAFEVRATRTRLTLAAAALPEPARPAFEKSMTTSAERILSSFESGRIDDTEARRALRMLTELAGGLIAIHTGAYTIVPSDEVSSSSDMKSIDVKTTTGDVLRVAVRPSGHAGGEARLKMENVVDDGVPVPKGDRMMVRFDLEGSREAGLETRASVDVQFGNEAFRPEDPLYERLNKRIHGVLLDENGQPVKNRGGSTVPDHHFKEGIPDALHDPQGFAAFATDFLARLAPASSETGPNASDVTTPARGNVS